MPLEYFENFKGKRKNQGIFKLTFANLNYASIVFRKQRMSKNFMIPPPPPPPTYPSKVIRIF